MIGWSPVILETESQLMYMYMYIPPCSHSPHTQCYSHKGERLSGQLGPLALLSSSEMARKILAISPYKYHHDNMLELGTTHANNRGMHSGPLSIAVCTVCIYTCMYMYCMCRGFEHTWSYYSLILWKELSLQSTQLCLRL